MVDFDDFGEVYWRIGDRVSANYDHYGRYEGTVHDVRGNRVWLIYDEDGERKPREVEDVFSIKALEVLEYY